MGGCVSTVPVNDPHDTELANATLKSVPTFTFEGMECPCKVLDVYDGDTITVAFRYAGQLFKARCRMAGYDSPELRPSRKDPNRDQIIAAAKRARDYLASRIKYKIVNVVFGKFDKYGRPLITVYLNRDNVNKMMLKAGHGYEYNGGTKRAIHRDIPEH